MRGVTLWVMSVGAGPVAAQERPDSATRLPVRSILISVTPSTGASVASGIPARAIVIDRAKLQAAGARSLPAALSGTGGVSAYDDLGSPWKMTLVSRGFAASPVVGLPQGLSVFVDGVRVNEPEAAQVNFDLLPLEHVSRVEVLQGTSALLGRNSLGGAVNLVTRGGRDAPRASLEGSLSEYGGRRAVATLGGASRARDWFVAAGAEEENGWRQATNARQRHVLLNGGTGTGRRIRALAFAATSRARTAGSLPASVFAVRPDSNLSADDYEDLGQLHLATSGWAPVARGDAHATLFLRRHGAERFNRNQAADPDILAETENRSIGAVVDWRRTWSRGSLRAGGEATATDVAIDIYRDSTKFGAARQRSTRVASRGFDGAAFAMGELRRGRVTFTGGFRFDHLRSPYRNRLEPAFDTVNTFRRVSPRAGMWFQPHPTLTMHASWGQAFRAPSILELACSNPERPCPLPFALGDDPPLAPVIVDQAEGGVSWTRGAVRLGGAVFRSDARNDIYLHGSEVDVSGSSIDGYFANIGSTRRVGVEADGEVVLGRGATSHASWTWTRATFQTEADVFSLREDDEAGIENEVEPGDRLPLVPSHVVKAGVSWPFPGGLTAVVDVRYVGTRSLRGDEANDTEPLGGYAVTDLRLSWTRGAFGATVSLRNAAGRSYASFGGFNINQGYPGGARVERFLTPGEPRWLTLAVRWEKER